MCAMFALELCYNSSWAVPVPSKFRGCWEALVQNLLITVYHDIGLQIYEHLFGGSGVAQVLSDFEAQLSSATDAQSTELWRTEKALRARKLKSFMNDPQRSNKLWKSVQATESVYLRYFCPLMKQQEFCSLEDVLEAKWSLFSMISETAANPWLCAIDALWHEMSPERWVEHSLWHFSSFDLPLCEVEDIEALLLRTSVNIWQRFAPEFLWPQGMKAHLARFTKRKVVH